MKWSLSTTPQNRFMIVLVRTSPSETVGRSFFNVRNLSVGQSVDASNFRPRTHKIILRFVPTVLLIFSSRSGTHYYSRFYLCPMDCHKDCPMESPKPYRNRNRYLYLYILYVHCPMDVLWTHFSRIGVLQKYFRKIKDFLLTLTEVVLSYAHNKTYPN